MSGESNTICFRCGEVEPEYTECESTGLLTCNSCGQVGVVTLVQAADLLNNLYRDGVFKPVNIEPVDDSIDYEIFTQ